MRSLKAISALVVLLAATAACAAPAAITGFAGYVKARPAPSTMTGTEVLPLVQSGTTTALPLSGLAAYVVKGVTPATIGAQPALGFTPLNRAGDTMTGNLFAPVLATGGTAARMLADRASDPGFSVLDLGVKCDGSDETTAMQAAVDAAAAVKVRLTLVPRGKTCTATSLGMREGSHVIVDGTLQSTGLKQSLIAPYSFVYKTGGVAESNVVIEGDGTLDNLMPGGPNIPAPATVACILTHGTNQFWTVRGVTLKNCGAWPVHFDGATKTPGAGNKHIYLSYVKMLDSSNSPEFAACDDCWADHIYVHNIGDYSFAFYSNVRYSGITNSTLDVGAGGVAVLADGLSDASQTTVPDNDILVQGGVISNQAGPAVYVQNSVNGTKLPHHNVRVIGVSGHNNNTNGNQYWGGVAAYWVDGLTMVGNSWSMDGAPASNTSQVGSAGVFLDATTSHVTSVGDRIFDEAPTGGAGMGFVLNGATYVSILSPAVFDDQPSATMQAAYLGTFGAQGSILGGTYTRLAQGTMPNVVGGAAFNVVSVPGADTSISNALTAPRVDGGTSGFTSNGVAGVSCSGTPTASYAVTLGIVTHC